MHRRGGRSRSRVATRDRTNLIFQIAVVLRCAWQGFGDVLIAGACFNGVASPFPSVPSTHLVSRDGGTEPRWAHSGRELFFKGPRQLMAVDIAPGPTFVAGTPRPLFSLSGYRSAIWERPSLLKRTLRKWSRLYGRKCSG